ncbi:MAG: anaerobic ribonucleoside-triphosphate reductase, partial [Hydrogenophaga sp.]|nr:anaerobic ribonucleoside-triphosphate reductase [Hydrogenophaga sp.]
AHLSALQNGHPPFNSKEVQGIQLTAADDRVRLLADTRFTRKLTAANMQRKYTGGTVLHLYMGERLSSGEACRALVQRALTNFRLPYITVTPTFSICPTHGYLAGEHPFCPVCDAEKLAAKRQLQAA